MVTYHPHTLVTFGGKLNTGVADEEIWQCGIRVMKPGAAGPLDDHDAWLTFAAPKIATWFTAAAPAAFPNSAALTWLKANPIGADGTYSDPVTHLHDYSTPQMGTVIGSGQIPDVLCIALSWQTAKAIRRHQYATHGRIYPPNYVGPASGNGMRTATGVSAAWATKGHDLLTAMSGTDNPCVPIVASGHAGEYSPITGVRVGDVYDMQRKRKSALNEVYSAVAFSTA
jgi:hypothetical protein